MNNYKAYGIIIKRTNIGEADRLLTVLTPEYGKITVVAKGVRKITSHRSPNLELFNLVSLVIHRGRISHYVSEAKAISSYEHMRSDLAHIASSYQLCELINLLTREGQDLADVYDLLVSSFERLNSGMNFSMMECKHTLLLLLGFTSDEHEYDIDSYIEELAQRRLMTKRLYE